MQQQSDLQFRRIKTVFCSKRSERSMSPRHNTKLKIIHRTLQVDPEALKRGQAPPLTVSLTAYLPGKSTTEIHHTLLVLPKLRARFDYPNCLFCGTHGHLSCSRRVSLESRYGMCFPLPSTSAEMTLPRAESERLILHPSFNRSPVAPVLLARSDPARSTRFSCRAREATRRRRGRFCDDRVLCCRAPLSTRYALPWYER